MTPVEKPLWTATGGKAERRHLLVCRKGTAVELRLAAKLVVAQSQRFVTGMDRSMYLVHGIFLFIPSRLSI